MIQANELRIGNWVLFAPNTKISRWVLVRCIYEKEKGISTLDKGLELGLFLADVHPIPLTAEVFGKCGFDAWDRKLNTEYSKEVGNDGFKLNGIFNKEYKSFQFLLVGNGVYDELGETDLTDNCNSLHQLQNLYYALTGKELEIKL